MEIIGQRLLDASQDGTLERVEALLQQGASVNYTNLYGETALQKAASGGHLEVVNKLLDAGADINVMNMSRGTALNAAASGGHLEVVNKLLDAGADVDAMDRYGETALHKAASGGHLEVVNKLLDAGADVNVKKKFGDTALQKAASGGHLEVVNKLLDAGVDVMNMYGQTALLKAASGGHLEVVNKLLDAGANVNLMDGYRETALHRAASGGHLEVVNKLLDAGANVNIMDGFGETALHKAARGGHLETVNKLLDAGADVMNMYKRTPLQLAVMNGHHEVVKKLLGAGAAVKVTDSVPHMNNVLIVSSAKDSEKFLTRFRQDFTVEPLREVPYSLYIVGRKPKEVSNILRALPQDKNLEGLFVTNATGKLSVDDVFHRKYPSITKLTIINCGIQRLPKDIDQHFPNVEELVLTNNDLKIVPDSIGNLSCLRMLRVSRNGLKVLPETIGKLKNLKELYCAHNKLNTLPDSLSRLSDSLLRIDVKHNSIGNLPTAITILLKRVLAFDCADNPLIKELGSEKKNDIITYLEDLGNGTVDNKEVKLAVVGEEGVGKTTLVQALRSKDNICTHTLKKTDGIVISPLQIEDVTFTVFDTAGDADFLETHLLFTSPNCLYLHVYNISTMGIDEQAGIQLGRLEMWLKSIFVQAPDSRNVIVGTHADSTRHSKEMNALITHQLDSVLGKAKKAHSERFQSNAVEDCCLCQEQSSKPCGSEINSSEGNIPHVVGRHEVSSVKKYPTSWLSNPSVKNLKRLLVDRARKLLNDVPRTPRNWMDLLEVWRGAQRLPLLYKEEAQRIAVYYGVIKDSKFCLMLNFFTNKGYIVYHEKVPDVIVLDPQWLANQLCCLISFKQDWIQNGILKPEDLKKAFQGTDDRWQQEVIKLFRHFKICFPLGDGRELFPCRLPLGMPAHSLWPPIPDKEDRQVSYMCQLSFVPNSLFPELVVAVNENPNVDEFPAARFFCNRAIYQTREKHDSCHSCKNEPFQSYEKPHRVHLELSYPKNAVLVTVRGPRPCCIAKSMCDKIKSLAGENTNIKITPLCPKCVVEKVGDASGLIITPSKPAKPANHIACEIGHRLGRQDDVLRGQLNFTPEPSTKQNDGIEDGNCPRLFVMLPINKEALSFMKYYTLLKDGFALHVLCEHPGEWHFLSTPGFRLPKLQLFIEKYGGRAYKVLQQMVKAEDSGNICGPVPGHLFGENRDALERFLNFYDKRYPSMKEEATLINLKKPTDTEDLKRSSLKKLLNISNDPDQVQFPDLKPVKVKNEVLWLCLKHAKSSLPNQSVAPMQEPFKDATQDSKESHMDMAGEYAQAKEDTSGQDYSDSMVASLRELDGLSWQIIPFWESLGRKLGVRQGTIDNLSYTWIYPEPREKAFQLLKAWYDDGGTYRQLAEALKTLGREDLVKQYCVKHKQVAGFTGEISPEASAQSDNSESKI